MAANTAQEQLMLELINRARMNPAAEAARQGISLNQGLAPGTISTAPKQVLAMNDDLVLSSDRHSNWMLVNDVFNHNETAGTPGFTGIAPSSRMTAAGYVFAGPAFSSGENISWTGTTGTINLTTAIIGQHRSLFLSAGHRMNILNATFEEVGIGQERGFFLAGGINYDASMVTQNFALSGSKVFVTGVVYNDTVNDNFFSVGEQTVGGSIAGTGGISDVTGGGGGYELAFATGGSKTITFGLATGAISVGVTVAATNLKIDIVNGHEVWTNAHLSVIGGPVTELHALGIQGINLTGGGASERLFGNAAGNRLTGNAGNDVLDGAGGNDVIPGGAGNDTLVGGLGIDTLTGGLGNDYFVFNAPLNAANRDVITDSNHVNDTFRLENAVMTKLGAGVHALSPAFFRAGAAAADANDYVVYNRATGYLSYDSNGSAAGGLTLLAVLNNKPVLAANDFAVI